MIKSASSERNSDDQVREANDILRSSLVTGNLAAKGPEYHRLPRAAQCRLHAAVRHYTNFTLDNDPGGLHARGQVLVDGRRWQWEILALDSSLMHQSPDPVDPNKTRRVLIFSCNS